MKRTIVALGLALGFLAATPAVANADTPGCVTKNEFQRVHRGDNPHRVRHIFDTRGHRTSRSGGGAYTDVYREYNVCPRWSRSRYSSVEINFDNYSFSGRGFSVYSKSQYIYNY